MAKKKRRRRSVKRLAPEGLWVSPDGERVVVVEHLIALLERPDLFGLSHREVSGANVEALRQIAECLIAKGWTRFRYLAGVYAFEVDSAAARIAFIEQILHEARAYASETVTISQVAPRREWEATVADVYDRKVLRFQQNPARNRWRFS